MSYEAVRQRPSLHLLPRTTPDRIPFPPVVQCLYVWYLPDVQGSVSKERVGPTQGLPVLRNECQFQYRRLPFCARCVSGVCHRCRSQVRVSISEMDPKTINLSGGPPGPRMPCGWGCGAKLTTSQMRRHFTDCPRRLTILETMRPLPSKPNRGGRPPGPRMPCAWQCRAKLTATTMRKHFSRLPQTSNRFDVRNVPVMGASTLDCTPSYA